MANEEDIMRFSATPKPVAPGRLLWAAALCIAIVAGCSGTDTTENEATALQTIEDAYASFNDGDAAAWVEIRERGSAYPSQEMRDRVMDDLADEVTEQVQGGARFEDIECESQGLGEWPVADEGTVEGYYFTCDTTYVDADGDERIEPFEWVVDDGEVVAVRSR